MCVCVCVCVREREREREYGLGKPKHLTVYPRLSLLPSPLSPPSQPPHLTLILSLNPLPPLPSFPFGVGMRRWHCTSAQQAPLPSSTIGTHSQRCSLRYSTTAHTRALTAENCAQQAPTSAPKNGVEHSERVLGDCSGRHSQTSVP
jgi:hypothetical protein